MMGAARERRPAKLGQPFREWALLFAKSLHRSPVKGAVEAPPEHSAKTSREQVITHYVPTR